MELIKAKSFTEAQSRAITGFKGINYAQTISDGEIAEGKNLSSNAFPCLSPRRGRKNYGAYIDPTGLFSWDKLVVIDNGNLYYDGEILGSVGEDEKQVAVINTKLCIFPDKRYVDLVNKEFKSLDPFVETAEGTAVFTHNTLTFETNLLIGTNRSANFNYLNGDSKKYQNAYVWVYTGLTWTSEGGWKYTTRTQQILCFLQVGQVFIPAISETGGDYMSNNLHGNIENNQGYYGVITWTDEENCQVIGGQLCRSKYSLYQIREQSASLTETFKVGDRVTISGCTVKTQNNVENASIKALTNKAITFPDNTFASANETSAIITVQKKIPDLDFICSMDNRLWGVSNKDKTIYASSLGDPTNFYVYDGLSTDSYAVAVATKEDFTGMAAYSGNILCFKEHLLHRVYGTMPSNYTLYSYDIEGVQKGSHKSLQVVNETLFYKGIEGVYLYTGTTPELVSYNFGRKRFSDAVAGTNGIEYYISMKDENGAYSLLKYDSIHGFWLREDDLQVRDFTFMNGELYMLAGKEVLIANSESEEMVVWEAELAPFLDAINKKEYKAFKLRAEVSDRSSLELLISIDDSDWIPAYRTEQMKGTVKIPVKLGKCDNFKVKLVGKGDCKVYALIREFFVEDV